MFACLSCLNPKLFVPKDGQSLLKVKQRVSNTQHPICSHDPKPFESLQYKWARLVKLKSVALFPRRFIGPGGRRSLYHGALRRAGKTIKLLHKKNNGGASESSSRSGSHWGRHASRLEMTRCVAIGEVVQGICSFAFFPATHQHLPREFVLHVRFFGHVTRTTTEGIASRLKVLVG